MPNPTYTTANNYDPALNLGFKVPIDDLDTTGASSGNVPTFNGTNVVWGVGGGFSLPITTVLTSGTATYDQTNNFLGLGIPGAGQIFDTGSGGINIIASIDTTAFGGQKDFTIIGYFNPFLPGNANANFIYDSVLGEASTSLQSEDATGNFSAGINIDADSTSSRIQFSYNGTGTYTFPSTNPTLGTVLGYVGPNLLGWVTPAGGGIAIGDAVSSATAGSVLFIDGSGNLAQDANQFVYTAGGDFAVRHSGLDYLRVNYSTADYGIGDIQSGGNKTNLRIYDSASSIYAYASAGFFVNEPTTGYVAFKADPSARVTIIGDVNSSFNKTRISVNDTSGDIDISTYGSGSIIKIGDTGSYGNDTLFQSDDFAKQTFVQTGGTFAVQTPAGAAGFRTTLTAGTGNFVVEVGDVNGVGTSVLLTVDETNTRIIANTRDGAFSAGDYNGAFNSTYMTVNDSAQIVVLASTGICSIGDANSLGNSTLLAVNDGTQTITVNKPLILQGYTVATLPAGTVGMTAYVTNALAPTFGATVVGGGAVTIQVFYDGTNWIVG